MGEIDLDVIEARWIEVLAGDVAACVQAVASELCLLLDDDPRRPGDVVVLCPSAALSTTLVAAGIGLVARAPVGDDVLVAEVPPSGRRMFGTVIVVTDRDDAPPDPLALGAVATEALVLVSPRGVAEALDLEDVRWRP